MPGVSFLASNNTDERLEFVSLSEIWRVGPEMVERN